ncbi:GIY-YIG nuclease family protein [uncultured Ilyobacter sp.]|uniref:GIY-YIG nuclease family protein n=1 Tax=uncultured Ilyobacter sp. TaxID=544433 RepID=UPI0029C771F9|nr:GIY-YIG nuclease family protein [uncultured Ilyobacter sp.]
MGKKVPYHIYIIRCQDSSLYTGIAREWHKRYIEHLEGRGAKYTRSHKPQVIEGVWEAFGRSEASKVECFIKSISKNKKESFLKGSEDLIREVFERFQIEIRKIEHEFVQEHV